MLFLICPLHHEFYFTENVKYNNTSPLPNCSVQVDLNLKKRQKVKFIEHKI